MKTEVKAAQKTGRRYSLLYSQEEIDRIEREEAERLGSDENPTRMRLAATRDRVSVILE